MMSQNKEIRTITDSEVRLVGNSRNIEGYGIVFNRESRDLGGFTEVILPESVKGVIENSDILALLNHNKNRGVLARSIKGKGSMSLTVDKKGVKYSFQAPNFDLGDELVEGIKRGDISESSFGFAVKEDRIEKKENGQYLRTILKFERLYEMSPVYNAAYEDTTVALRHLEEVKEAEEPPVKPVIEEPIAEPITEREVSRKELLLRERNNLYKLKNLNR